MSDFKELVWVFIDMIFSLLPIFGSLALLVFIWGLAKFIFKAGDEKAVEEGKNLIKWGLVALFVLVSLISIIYFFYGDLGFTGEFGYPLLPGLSENP